MFANNLKRLRKERRISQQELAKALNFAQSTICMWESGRREPDFKTMQVLASFFGISVDELAGTVPGSIRVENQINGNGNQSTITLYNGSVHTRELSEIEIDLMKVCEKLSTRKKALLLSRAYELLSEIE